MNTINQHYHQHYNSVTVVEGNVYKLHYIRESDVIRRRKQLEVRPASKKTEKLILGEIASTAMQCSMHCLSTFSEPQVPIFPIVC